MQISTFVEDRRDLLSLFALADDSPTQVARHLNRGDILVARDRGEIVGLAQVLAMDDPTVFEIKSLAVSTPRQQEGIGSSLVSEAAVRCRHAGARRLIVATAAADTSNLRFYQRRGFRMYRIAQDVFVPANGYPADATSDGIALRDQVLLELDLERLDDRLGSCRVDELESARSDARPGLRTDEMTTPQIQMADDNECAELEVFLVECIRDFNAQATGYFDAKAMGGSLRAESGELIAAFNGYTWGSCCVVEHLWVHQSHRGKGIGQALLRAAEVEARRRSCGQLVVSTHSFQAPAFYERLGYERRAVVADQPRGHANITYVKRLAGEQS